MKSTLLCSACCLTFVFAVPAQARTVNDAVANEQPAVVDPTADRSETAPATSDPAGDIVVTALRTSQTLQNTPAAVTVLSGEALARQQIFDIRGVQQLVPSARFSASYTSTRIFIRGVGSQLDFYWVPESTAVNLNGTYIPRFATTGALYDVESVQVLPGPQGVLYGRSAGGGAVVINTRKPSDRNEASGLLEYGNYNTLHFEGMGNVKVSDTLAIRVAGATNRHDGYQTFGLQSDDSFSGRLSALYKPTDNVSLYLWGTHFEQRGLPTAVEYLPVASGSHAWDVPANDPVTGRNNSTGARMDFKYTLAGYDLGFQLGTVRINNLGSILHQTEQSLRKLIGSDQVLDNAQTQYVQNLHLSGTTGSLDWVGGIDWLFAKSRNSSQLGPNRLGSIFPIIRQRNLSGFAQGTLTLAQGVRLVAGARYTKDSLYLNGTTIRCFGPCVLPPVTFDQSWEHLDLKGGVEVDIAPKVLGYANVQTGYVPGTLNISVANGTTPPAGVSREIFPQTLLAYTAGIKSSLGDGLITLNIEGYYYNYKRLIIQSFVAAFNQQTLFNAPTARVYGLQLMSVLRPTRQDTLSANVAYTNGRYGSFQATPVAVNIGGLQMTYTPDWTASLSYDHRFDLANGANIDARVSTYISSSYWGTFDHAAGAQQGSYMKTDASLMYHSANDRITAGIWIKNIENEAVFTAPASSGFAPPFAGITFLEPPRTYGLTLGFKL